LKLASRVGTHLARIESMYGRYSLRECLRYKVDTAQDDAHDRDVNSSKFPVNVMQ